MRTRSKKILLLIAGFVIALYTISYALLAKGGGYHGVPSGQFRPLGYLASADMLVWQPRIGTFYAFRQVGGEDTYHADWIGRLYSPLILLQQATISPSIRTVLSDGSFPSPRPRLPARHQLHPQFQQELPSIEKDIGMSWEQMVAKFEERA